MSLHRSTKVGQAIVLIGASCYFFVYLVVALIRISYPFELEWMEGGAVVHVERVLNGRPLYVQPSLDFIPYIYSPFYFYVSSLFARVTGNGFLPLRLVSLLSSLGCFALILMIVRRRTASLYAGAIAACLFAATFSISGAWFDIARVDSLFLVLVLGGIYALDSPRVLVCAVLSPTLLFLAFFTKQTALVMAASLSAAALLTHKRSVGIAFTLILGLLMVGSYLTMNKLTEGWYGYYVFDLPSQHHMVKSALVRFWTSDVIRYLGPAICVCVIPFLGIGADTNSKSTRFTRDCLILGSLLLASYFSRIHSGGYRNVLMPAYAGIAVYFGIGFALALRAIGGNSKFKALLVLAAALQFGGLVYSPGQLIPSTSDRRCGEKLLRLVSNFEGEVYLPGHPWYLESLNKPSQAHEMAVKDLFRASDSGRWKSALKRDMARAIAEKRYEAFIVDIEDFVLRVPGFEAHYKLAASDLSGNAFRPVAGSDRRPTYLYVGPAIGEGADAPADTLRR